MLNPPMSLLADELLACIVEHVAMSPFSDEMLHNLSLADRAFTPHCQAHIFRTLTLGSTSGSKKGFLKKLEKTQHLLDIRPSIANEVHLVVLIMTQKRNGWILSNATIINILRLLSKAPRPPHQLHICGSPCFPIEDPVLLAERIEQSFFSQTLTVLHLWDCMDVPLPVIFVCPGLKQLVLDAVIVTDMDGDNYPERLMKRQDVPYLEVLDFRNSKTLIQQIIEPPHAFYSPVVGLSRLRILMLSPHEKEEMTCLQHILDEACESLEQLYLTKLKVGHCVQFPLSGLVGLRRLSFLRVFALHAVIKCGSDDCYWVLRDIQAVLSTVVKENRITNLAFHFTIDGEFPFLGCLHEDWDGLRNEIIRISEEKPVEMEFKMGVSPSGRIQSRYEGEEDLYANIRCRMALLSNHPKICAHYWDPTCWRLGIGPPPLESVRGRCNH